MSAALVANSHASSTDACDSAGRAEPGPLATANQSSVREAERSFDLYSPRQRTETSLRKPNCCPRRWDMNEPSKVFLHVLASLTVVQSAGLHNAQLHLGWFEEARLLVMAYKVGLANGSFSSRPTLRPGQGGHYRFCLRQQTNNAQNQCTSECCVRGMIDQRFRGTSGV